MTGQTRWALLIMDGKHLGKVEQPNHLGAEKDDTVCSYQGELGTHAERTVEKGWDIARIGYIEFIQMHQQKISTKCHIPFCCCALLLLLLFSGCPGTYYAVEKNSFKLEMIPLPQPPDCWDYVPIPLLLRILSGGWDIY